VYVAKQVFSVTKQLHTATMQMFILVLTATMQLNCETKHMFILVLTATKQDNLFLKSLNAMSFVSELDLEPIKSQVTFRLLENLMLKVRHIHSKV